MKGSIITILGLKFVNIGHVDIVHHNWVITIIITNILVDHDPTRDITMDCWLLVNQHNDGKSPFLMGKVTLSMVIVTSYFDITIVYRNPTTNL